MGIEVLHVFREYALRLQSSGFTHCVHLALVEDGEHDD